MDAGTNTYIFLSLEKFANGNGAELNSFLAKFDRCCLVGNKADADGQPIKGQLLMLFVEGPARATLEEFEQTRVVQIKNVLILLLNFGNILIMQLLEKQV